MKYNVFSQDRFIRSVDAFSSFDARKVVATFNGGSVTDFYAIRDDLMTDRDRARMEGQTGLRSSRQWSKAVILLSSTAEQRRKKS